MLLSTIKSSFYVKQSHDIFGDELRDLELMALLGKVEQFDPEQEDWPQYVERLEQFFEANDLGGDDKADKRRATFLAVIGPAPYKLLRSLITPAKPKEKKYDELVATLTEHYSPVPSEVMQRFRFNSRAQKAGEMVSAYVAELRRLAQYCNYGDTLEKMLRDRIVVGINDESTQKKLLQVKDLTYAKTLSIAQGFETAERNMKEMHHAPVTDSGAGIRVKPEPVHKMSGKKGSGGGTGESGARVTCYRCGKPGHLANVCRFRDSVVTSVKRGDI